MVARRLCISEYFNTIQPHRLLHNEAEVSNTATAGIQFSNSEVVQFSNGRRLSNSPMALAVQ